MSEILENYKTRYEGKLNEVYEIVKTVEVVTAAKRIIRIEIVKNYTRGLPYSYKAKYWEVRHTHLQPSYPKENGKFVNSPEDKPILSNVEYPWVESPDPDIALMQALNFVTGKE